MRTRYVVQRTGDDETYDFDLVEPLKDVAEEHPLTSIRIDGDVNEMLRQLEGLIGSLNKRDYIMLDVVHENFTAEE